MMCLVIAAARSCNVTDEARACNSNSVLPSTITGTGSTCGGSGVGGILRGAFCANACPTNRHTITTTKTTRDGSDDNGLLNRCNFPTLSVEGNNSTCPFLVSDERAVGFIRQRLYFGLGVPGMSSA